MEYYMVMAAAVAAAALSMGFMLWLIPYLQRKGVHIGGYLSSATAVSEGVGAAFDALRPLLPDTRVVAVLDKLFDYANRAVEYAEQLYKANEIGAAERKAAAREFTLLCLKELRIEVTDELLSIIDGAIDGAVLLLPKTHDANGSVLK